MARPWEEIFVLNLRRSRGHWADMRVKLGQMGLSACRLEGMDRSELSSEHVSQNTTGSCAAFCTPATVGCFLSHRNAWKRVVDEDLRSALILEDNAEFAPDFHEMVDAISRELPDDFDLLLL
jgi:glycosyl transferase family 25